MSQTTDEAIGIVIDATTTAGEPLQPGCSSGESMLIVGDDSPLPAANMSDGQLTSLQSCISEIQEELEQRSTAAIGDGPTGTSTTDDSPVPGDGAGATAALAKDLEAATLIGVTDAPDADDDVDYLHNADWLAQSDHVFVLNTSGKPIYTLHGSEDKLATIFGVMQALVSVVASNGDDAIESVRAAGVQIVFLVKAPLVLVAVSKSRLSVQQMQMELT